MPSELSRTNMNNFPIFIHYFSSNNWKYIPIYVIFVCSLFYLIYFGMLSLKGKSCQPSLGQPKKIWNRNAKPSLDKAATPTRFTIKLNEIPSFLGIFDKNQILIKCQNQQWFLALCTDHHHVSIFSRQLNCLLTQIFFSTSQCIA